MFQNVLCKFSLNVPTKSSANVRYKCSLNVPMEGSRNVLFEYSLNIAAERSLNIPFELSWNVPQEHSENIALERSKNPDIFLVIGTFLERSDGIFRTLHGIVQGRYCAMGVMTGRIKILADQRRLTIQHPIIQHSCIPTALFTFRKWPLRYSLPHFAHFLYSRFVQTSNKVQQSRFTFRDSRRKGGSFRSRFQVQVQRWIALHARPLRALSSPLRKYSLEIFAEWSLLQGCSSSSCLIDWIFNRFTDVIHVWSCQCLYSGNFPLYFIQKKGQ